MADFKDDKSWMPKDWVEWDNEWKQYKRLPPLKLPSFKPPSWTDKCPCGSCTARREREKAMKPPEPTDDKYGHLPIAVVMLLEEVAHIEKTTHHISDGYVSTEIWASLNEIGNRTWMVDGGLVKLESAGSSPELWYVERPDKEVFGFEEDPGQADPVRLRDELR